MARPLEHNREQVIEAAMQLFWHKGYSATSMADLKSATGLNSGSIYSSYKSKEELFVATLEHYCERSITKLESTLKESDNVLVNIYRFFESFFETTDSQTNGCYFVNTLIEMAPHSERVDALLSSYTKRYREAFSAALERAVDAKLLSAQTNVALKSDQLLMIIWGMRVIHRGAVAIDSQRVVKQQLDDVFAGVVV